MWTLVVLCSCAVKIISCSFFAKIPHRANRVIKMHSLCSRFFAPIFENIVNAAQASLAQHCGTLIRRVMKSYYIYIYHIMKVYNSFYTFLPDWQPPLIFVRFISNFLCICTISMANQTKIKGSSQLGRKVVPHDSKSDLPLASAEIQIRQCP